jgi:putative hydrolase of the HAD superfamily
MDGTLLDLYFDNHFWLHHLPVAYASAQNMSLLDAKQQLVARFAAEQGTLNWYCLDFWAQELNLDIPTLKKEIAHLIRPRPGALDFLQALNDCRKEAWLITNAHRKSLSIKLAHTPLSSLCNRIISSHDYRFPKESPDFWKTLQSQAPFNPTRTLFIDDSESVLHAAQHYGIAHLLTIAQPDSQLPHRDNLHFTALHHFAEIMPIPSA